LSLISSAQTAPQSRIVQSIDNFEFTAIRGSAHPKAMPEFDHGPVDGGMRFENVVIEFKRSATQQQDMNALLAEQQDSASPNYHKWLTPQQMADRFGMSPDDLAKVSVWLSAQGFTVDNEAGNRTHISFSGNAAQIKAAFHTEIHYYNVNGDEHFANASAVSVPAAFSSVVLGVRGLSNFRPKSRAVRNMSASPRLNSQGSHLLAPQDFATIYDVQKLYGQGIDGTGQKIVIIGQIKVTMSDIDSFRSASGLSVNDPTVVVVPNTGTPVFTNAGDLRESDLDLEWSGAVAKNATILFVTVGPTSSGGAFDSLFWAIDPSSTNVAAAPLAPVISSSYGACEAENGQAFALQLQQAVQSANAQGTTVTAAAGDQGAADCDDADSETIAIHGLAVDMPADIPEVSAVGGTEFSTDKTAPATYWNSVQNAGGGSVLSYIPEGIWNDTSEEGILDGGGGGVSTIFAVPSWQTGVHGLIAGGRNVPDVALNASNNHDPYVFCSSPPGTAADCTNGFLNAAGQIDAVGGTSVGAPTFAAILALVDQAVSPTGLGNVNPVLYPLLGTTPNAFHDVTIGNNIMPCTPGTPSSDPVNLRCPSSGSMGYSAAVGYDQVSGLGSVDAYNLVTGWPGFVAAPSYTLAGTAVTIASPGAVGTSTMTVAATNGFNGTVALTCTPPASATALITCSVTPSVSVNGSNATATLTINTIAATVAMSSPVNRFHGMSWFAVSGGGLFAGILLLGAPSRGRKSTAMLGLLLLVFAVTGIGCGVGSSKKSTTVGGTPEGNYTVIVTAVSGSITQTANVAVTVE
jgi:subtilase family serine protease